VVARSLPKGQEPWQTFSVTVRTVRGRSEVYAEVTLSHVTGIVGSTGVRPRPLYQGVVTHRRADSPFSPEEAATVAAEALSRAFPALF
jgi:hypothetical protein